MKRLGGFARACAMLLFAALPPYVSSLHVQAVPAPYAGKVAINGLNFSGNAQFTFALRDANGSIHWRNGADANASINVPVDRGHYLVLLGGHSTSGGSGDKSEASRGGDDYWTVKIDADGAK